MTAGCVCVCVCVCVRVCVCARARVCAYVCVFVSYIYIYIYISLIIIARAHENLTQKQNHTHTHTHTHTPLLAPMLQSGLRDIFPEILWSSYLEQSVSAHEIFPTTQTISIFQKTFPPARAHARTHHHTTSRSPHSLSLSHLLTHTCAATIPRPR